MTVEDFFGYPVLQDFEDFEVPELVIQMTQLGVAWMFLHEDGQEKLEELMVQVSS